MFRFLAVGLIASSLLCAQEFRASLSGVVTDPSGAAVPGAAVRALRQGTEAPIGMKTNREGYYTFPFLDPGIYEVEASASGFQTRRVGEVVLLTAEKRDLPFQLGVAQERATVEVVAAAERLQTADASGGTNFDSVQTAEYALNGRQAYMLMDLAPGVLFTQEQFGTTGFSGTRGWDVTGAYSMNGGQTNTNQFLMNGAPVSLTGAWQISPNVEAIQEFKVMTNTYDARYGRTGGGTINTTLKSGTNQLHGSVFEYFRNSVLDANVTQNNRVGSPRGKHITHQYGGVVGGAVRKDKDFFFLSFEGFREVVPFPSVQNVPPADLRDGKHFDNYGIKVYDPLTTRLCTGSGCTGSYVRDQFPGNVIPASRMSPIGQKILNLFPLPNTPGETQNYVTNNQSRIAYDQPIARFDHLFSPGSRLNVTADFQHGSAYRPTNAMPFPVAIGNISQERQPQHYILNFNQVLSPSTVFDLRASFGRYTDYNPNGNADSTLTPQDLGIKRMPYAPTAQANYPPHFNLDQYVSVVGPGYNWSTQNQWTFSPSITMARGRNTIHIGGEYSYAGTASGNTGSTNGDFSFTRTWTQRFGDRAGNRYDGSGTGDLLLGLPGSGFIDWNDTFYRTWPYLALFVQSDWKVRNNVTLNLGLRYDVQLPTIERWNRVNAGFDFNAVNPLSDRILAQWRTVKTAYDATNPAFPYPDPPKAILGGKTFVDGKNRAFFDPDWTNIQPRLGVAWNAFRRTVVRSGFGIYHKTATQTGFTDGYSRRTNYSRGDDLGDYVPRIGLTGPYSLEDPFPNGIDQPTGSSLGLLTSVGNGVSLDPRKRVIPRTFQYSFGLQQLLPWGFLLDASYVGSQTNHDNLPLDYGYIPLSLYNQGAKTPTLLNRTVPNPFFGILPVTSTFGAANTISAVNLYRNFPIFNGITQNNQPWAKYRYDSLQLRAERRMFSNRAKTGALTMVFSYTFSKSYEANHRLNNWNLSEPPIHELSSNDKPQMISFSGVWDLPFGRNRALLANSPAGVRAVVSGWNFNWIYTFRSGYPVAKPNAVFSCSSYVVSDQTRDHWFNNDTKCYSSRPNYTLRDTEDRFGNIRNPDAPQLNITLARTFRIRERYSLQMRGEAFNLTNTPLFGSPDTTYTSARFGMLPLEQRNFPRLIQLAAKILF